MLEDTVKYLDFARSLGPATVQHDFNDVSTVPASVRVHAHQPGSWSVR